MEKGLFQSRDSPRSRKRKASAMKRTATSDRLGSRNPRTSARAANSAKLPASRSLSEGLSTKSRMVTTKAAANATHSARSAERRDNSANKMNGEKPMIRFMLPSTRHAHTGMAPKKRGAEISAPRLCLEPPLLAGCGGGGVRLGLDVVVPQPGHARAGGIGLADAAECRGSGRILARGRLRHADHHVGFGRIGDATLGL